jgi:hypothetical protein
MLARSLAFGGLSQKLWQLGDIKRNSPRLISPGLETKAWG